eukprot:TRINITY_DN49959_c0_g1_i1.p1 TRINITY_DN49959_c0_g1~~TRINITY_DN49959_c0_g1_i1.p1  ORF type:complete len:392 (+),score=53.60 TRINITY_DN49959_c0_g1_i1:148-1323(+)
MLCLSLLWLCLLEFSVVLVFAETCSDSAGTCASIPQTSTSHGWFSRILEKVACNIERVDASAVKPKKFKKKYRLGNKPLIVKNWTRKWPAMSKWKKLENFIEQFSDYPFQMMHQVVPDYGDKSLGHSTLGEFWSSPQKHLLFDTAAKNFTSRAGADIQPRPKALNDVMRGPLYSIGKNWTGSSVHSHEEVWQSQVAGTKIWILAPREVKESDLGADGKISRVHPCELLLQIAENRASFHKSIQVCPVYPGDTLYLPNSMHHGTCNFGDFSLSVGGKGDSSGSVLKQDFKKTTTELVKSCDYKGLKAHIGNSEHVEARNRLEFTLLRLASMVNCTNIVEHVLGIEAGEEKVSEDEARRAVQEAVKRGHMAVLHAYAQKFGSEWLSEAAGVEL